MAPTVLDCAKAAGLSVVGVGKIEDLFAGHGLTLAVHTRSDDESVDEVVRAMAATDRGIIFANLVDFDAVYGHRNDVAGYAANLERVDARLPAAVSALRQDDLLMLTADHGNDPTTPSTDHTREYVPLLVTGPLVRAGVSLGTRRSFADLGRTLCEVFGLPPARFGTSFLGDL